MSGIRLDRDCAIATLTIGNGAQANVLSREARAGVGRAVDEVAASPSI